MSFLKEVGGGGRKERKGGNQGRKGKKKTKNLRNDLSGSLSTEVPPAKAPPWWGQTTGSNSGSLGKELYGHTWASIHSRCPFGLTPSARTCSHVEDGPKNLLHTNLQSVSLHA